MANFQRPVVGMNVDVIAASKVTRPHLRLNMGYLEAVLQAGGLPVLMPPYGKDKEIAAFLDRVDGFLLTGGQDLDPRRYGLPPHPAVQPIAERRDESDRILVRQIVERQMPVLGLGLGMHQLNQACGGSLYMHLPEDMPRSMPHSDPSCSGPHRHLVLVHQNTRLEEIYGCAELRVNSNHHQGIKTVGSPFRVCATAPDGVIEAMESEEAGWFAIGVQWHPETDSTSALDQQLFECFFQACTQQAPTLSIAA